MIPHACAIPRLKPKLAFRRDNPAPRNVSFVTRRQPLRCAPASPACWRAQLYDLDRIDLSAQSTLHAPVQIGGHGCLAGDRRS